MYFLYYIILFTKFAVGRVSQPDTRAAESQQLLQTTRMTNALEWLLILKALNNIGKVAQGMSLGTAVYFRCRTEIEGF
jgi:hypothetical protein